MRSNYPFAQLFRREFFYSWSDFYPGLEGSLVQQDNINTRYTTDNINLYLYDLEFINLQNENEGGALYFSLSNGVNYVLIEKTFFYQCNTTSAKSGGAVYFNKYGFLIFHQICCLKCNTGGNGDIRGQFCRCIIDNDKNISIISSSIMRCLIPTGSVTIHLSYGNQKLIKTNSSNNQNLRHSAFDIDCLLVSTITQSTFENNIANEYGPLWWHSSQITTSSIIFSNIINNSQLGTTFGVIGYHNHDINMNECSIIHC
jgi:hypothetical protein